MIAGTVTVSCGSDTFGDALATLLRFRDIARGHGGCLAFEVAIHPSSAHTIQLFEIWRDDGALAEHGARKETQTLRADLDRAAAVLDFRRYDLGE